MLFNSLAFLLFFPAVCVLYYCIPSSLIRARNLLLLVASYYFYMNWEPSYALLLLTSTVVTYIAALAIVHVHGRSTKRLCLACSLFINIVILFFFKYYTFLSSSITSALQSAGIAIDLPQFGLLLPVGISFYTFQAMGYSIDVFRNEKIVERDFFTYALFVSFFPQLVAGPIERSSNLLPQFRKSSRFDYDQAMSGLRLMVWGYFLKLVMADRCGIYVDAIFNNTSMHNGGSFLVASLLFTFQIYGDFAGYSLIAIGVARIMGFRLMQNFRYPYLATSVGDFWHRWHISLSTWFKDYVYIPLGGNRVSRCRHYRNLMLTFTLSGIWHGANWTFFCWGFVHGIMLCIEKTLGISGRRYNERWTKLAHCVVTFILINMTWILFRSNNLSEAAYIITAIFTNPGMPFIGARNAGVGCLIASSAAIAIVMAKDIASERMQYTSSSSVNRLCKKPMVQYLYIAFMMAVITLFGVLDGDQFIYFQF